MNPRPIEVIPLPDYRLIITFSNQEKRMYDAKPLIEIPLFERLKNQVFFREAKADGMCVFWNDEIDLCPDETYENSVPCE